MKILILIALIGVFVLIIRATQSIFDKYIPEMKEDE